MSTGPEPAAVGLGFFNLTLRRAIDEALLLISLDPFSRLPTFLLHPPCLTGVSRLLPLEAFKSRILQMLFLVTVRESLLSVWLALSEVALVTSDEGLLLARCLALTI